MSGELILNKTPPVLQAVNKYFNTNAMSMSMLYYAVGITVSVIAWTGVLLNDKNFIIPLIAYDSFIFLMYVATTIFIYCRPNVDLDLVVIILNTGIHYFALILEYSFYRELSKAGRSQSRHVESIIVLPPETSSDINPIIYLQQYRRKEEYKQKLCSYPVEPLPRVFQQVAGSSDQHISSYPIPLIHLPVDSNITSELPPPYSQ